MALTLFWRCEGTDLSGADDYSAGDQSATLSGGAVISSGNVRVGTNSLDAVSNGGQADFDLNSDIILSEGAMGCWFYYDGANISSELMEALDASATGDRIQLSSQGASGSGTARLTIGAHAVGATNIETADAGLTAANWYFMLGRWNENTTSGKVEVYDTNMALLASAENTSISATHFPTFANLDVLEIINQRGEIHVDNVFAADTYDEPIQKNALITSYTNYNGLVGDVNFFWRCEGLTLSIADGDWSDGDQTFAASGGAPAVQSTTYRVGSNALDTVTDTGIGGFTVSSQDLISSTGSLGFWFYVTLGDWTDLGLARIFDTDLSNDRVQVLISGTSGSGNIIGRVGNNGVGIAQVDTTSANLSEENWYFCVFRWHEANEDIRIEVYDTNLNIIEFDEDTSTGATIWPAWNNLDNFEAISGSGAARIYMDNMFITDDYGALLQDNALITSLSEYGQEAGTPPAPPMFKRRHIGFYYG